MRNVLVTGGAGFIGSNFVRHMAAKYPGVNFVVLDLLTYAGNLENLSVLDGQENYSFVKGDITDAGLLDDIFTDNSIDTVVNFAAESHVDRSILGPGEFVRTNIVGTFTLLEAARKHWQAEDEEKKFLHVSTDEVYGSLGPTGYFTEETPYRPNSPYSASKAAADHLVRAYGHTYGLSVLTTNCSNNYGPYQFPEKLIPLMIINALTGKDLPVYGDGANVRDWIHVLDHSKAVELVLRIGVPGETYNIGGRCEKKNLDIVNLVCDVVDEEVSGDEALASLYPSDGPRRSLVKFVKDRPGHDRRYAIDSTKIERELGWLPEVSFEEGIRSTVRWYIENRPWWERVISGEYMNYYKKQYGGR